MSNSQFHDAQRVAGWVFDGEGATAWLILQWLRHGYIFRYEVGIGCVGVVHEPPQFGVLDGRTITLLRQGKGGAW